MMFDRRTFCLFLGTLAGTITIDWLKQGLQPSTAQSPPTDVYPDPTSGEQPQLNPTGTETLPPTSDWFELKEEGKVNWNLVLNPADSLKATLEAKTVPQGAGKPKQVFVLFPKQSPAYDTAMDRILSVFYNKKVAAVFTLVNFDKDADLGEKALKVLKSGQFDMAFSMGSESTALFYQKFVGETIPVVSVCSKDPVLMGQMKDYDNGSGTNMAFTSLNVPIEVQMAYLKELRPNLKNIAVMYDRQNKSSIETQVKPLQDIAQRVQVNLIEVVTNDTTAKTDLEVEMPKALAKIVAADPGQQDTIFWITGSTAVFKEIETINRLADRVPVLSVVPDVVTTGDASAVMAIGISFESNAYLAAIYAVDILQGKKKPGELAVGVVSPPDLAVNFRKARKINLKIPFNFFETASFVYDHEGIMVREQGKAVRTAS